MNNNLIKRFFYIVLPNLYILITYGLILNFGWFFTSIYLQKNYFDRNFVLTIFVYIILISLIISKFYSKKFSWIFFIKSSLYIFFCLMILIIFYIFLLGVGFNYMISYGLLILTYSFLMSIILSKLKFIRINYIFYIWQVIICLVTIFCFMYLDGIQTYFYGLQFLFSTWILSINIYLFFHKAYKIFNNPDGSDISSQR